MPKGFKKDGSFSGIVFQKSHKINFGKKHSKQTRRKISVSNKGKKLSEENKRNISLSLKGYVKSEKHKKNLSKSLKGRITNPANLFKTGISYFRGKKHWNWKGGVSKNKVYQRKRRREYYYRSPVLRMANQRRLALKKAGGKLSIQTIQRVYEDNIKKYGTLTCYLCLMPIEFKQDNLEHKTPLFRGGTNEYCNLAVACQACNFRKHTKTEEEYKLQEVSYEKSA